MAEIDRRSRAILNSLKAARDERAAKAQEERQFMTSFNPNTADRKDFTRFRENLKSAGLGILLIIPFSPVTIPFFIRLAKKHQVDIIPNWYKKLDLNNDENKLE